MLDALIAAWLATATVRTMPDRRAEGAPLVLVVNTDVPPRETWHDIAHRDRVPVISRRRRRDVPVGPGA